MGATIGTAVVAQMTGKLMEKAADPEIVAKGVNWVFSAVDNFLKIRKGERPQDTPIAPPPEATPPAEPPAEVDELEVEDKAAAVQEIAKSLEQETAPPAEGGVRVLEMDDFTLRRLSETIESLISQLERYLDNLLRVEETAAEYGGLVLAPLNVRNDARRQQEEIAKIVRRLNKTMEQVYGVAAPDVDMLVRATMGQ